MSVSVPATASRAPAGRGGRAADGCPSRYVDRVEVPRARRRRRRRGPTARTAAARDGGLDVGGGGLGIEAEQRRQAVDHRRPARWSRRTGAHAVRTTIASSSSALDDLVGQAGLAGAGLADDRHDAAVAVAHELHGGVEQRPLVAPGRRTARRSAPGRLPAAAAPVTSHDCSTCSRPRMRVIGERLAAGSPTSTARRWR